MCCVVVCDLETSRMGAPYIYDISHLRVNKAIKGNFKYTLRQYNNYVYGPKNIAESRIKISLRIGYTRDLMTSIIFVLFSHFPITVTQLLVVSYRYPDIINVVYYY